MNMNEWVWFLSCFLKVFSRFLVAGCGLAGYQQCRAGPNLCCCLAAVTSHNNVSPTHSCSPFAQFAVFIQISRDMIRDIMTRHCGRLLSHIVLPPLDQLQILIFKWMQISHNFAQMKYARQLQPGMVQCASAAVLSSLYSILILGAPCAYFHNQFWLVAGKSQMQKCVKM